MEKDAGSIEGNAYSVAITGLGIFVATVEAVVGVCEAALNGIEVSTVVTGTSVTVA